ncbi:Right handed beta helix region [Dyadobacter koreensis]|uniref:Right handed beta helix region n=1 Tax=Dyadobacter koreensis TaxID=408657 RepID=A0A1H6Q9C9_9BACT|nr:right-handed parallel beta-helix repeat-containing protein [Dyadobacter koreensis]SEI40363.1 Right handed beta helix region [Dyadobacter koreensis]
MKNLKMKSVLLFFAVLCFHAAQSATYYVKASGGNGSGLSDQDAWSFEKLKASFTTGSTVLFKRGDVFYGTLSAENSNFTFDAYGEGANPVISGFKQLGVWSKATGNIYYTTLDVESLNMVTVDGVVRSMGRYPDAGYLKYTSHEGNSALSGETVSGIPFDPAGAEIVIRKDRWIIDRHVISSRSSNQLSYSANNHYGNNMTYSPVDGNGFFIQAHLGTLSKEGEWFYDKNAKRLYLYSASGSPEGKTVQVSTLARNFVINSQNNITINNIDFEGSNTDGVYLVGARNVTFNNCNFKNHGGNGVYGIDVSAITINGGSVSEVLNNGIWIENNGSAVTIDGVRTTNIGIIAGAGRSGDTAQEAISVYGTGTTIRNCSVISTGFNGINFSGSGDDVLVENNFVDHFCKIKDDGGGIYTFNSRGTNRKIKNNIVLNAVGAYQGAESSYWEAYGKAAGIYLDGGSKDTQIDNNVIAHGPWAGIFVNGTSDHHITNNLVYDFARVLLIHSFKDLFVRNLTVKNNVFLAKLASQSAMYVHMYFNDDPSQYGSFDKNTYARPINDANTITIQREYAGGGQANISLSDWIQQYRQDAGSSKSLVTTDQESNFRFDYNNSINESSVALDGNYADVTNKKYSSRFQLAPYAGLVLIKNPVTGLIESIASGHWSDPSIWSGGQTPKSNETVLINKGHVVTSDTYPTEFRLSTEGELKINK